MNMHLVKTDAAGTSCTILESLEIREIQESQESKERKENNALLAFLCLTVLLLGLPCGVLAQDAVPVNGPGYADNAGGDSNLTRMSDVRPDASTQHLPSFGGDPFAATTQDAAPSVAAPSVAAPSDVPNFGALPDIAKADTLRETGERSDKEHAESSRADKDRSRPDQGRDSDVRGKDSQDKDGQDRTVRKQDAQGRELASQGNGVGSADKSGKRPGKGDRLAIPEGAAQSRDTSFLAGCWRSESTLRRTGTGTPLQIEYCFDENGNGRRIHTETSTETSTATNRSNTNGDTVVYNRCEGPVTAAFKQHTLVIEGGEIPCTDGSSYSPTTVECSEVDGVTLCSGKEAKPDGSHHLWDARFRKSS